MTTATPATPQGATVEIRIARPEEYDAVGELTVRVYRGDGLVAADSWYLPELRDAAARAPHADLLVGVERATGRILGSTAFALAGSSYAEVAGAGEAEFRMLVVDPEARGRGIGEALVRECVTRARTAGCTVLRLSTQSNMRSAHRLYERLGFGRTPDRDWYPLPDVRLLTYELRLDAVYCDRCGEPLDAGRHGGCAAARSLEPPRWCPLCRRRMVVQVLPSGWTARCVEHGVTSG